MPSQLMAEFYANQAAELARAKKIKDNLAITRMEEIANIKPTPTVAELNTLVTSPGSISAASALVSNAKIMRPSPAELFMQRKYPIRS